jgi:predicted HicB family RNase H-like nuclease
MTPTKTRKAVTPPTNTKVEAKAPIVEKKFTPRFTNRKQEFKPTVYELISKAKRKNGMPQYPIVSLLKAEDIIFDPITGENRKIRYVPGETSIFADEQPENARMREPIAFNNGYIFVDHTNPTLKKYLDTCNANGSNPHRIKSKNIMFKVRDNEKSAKDKISKVNDTMDAVQAALKMPLNELIGYAKVLGVNTDKSVDEIRWDMKIQAEKNPKGFLAGMNDPRTEMKQLLLMAQESGIIRMDKKAITWVSSGNTICVPAIGTKPIDRMVDFCSEGEGEQIYAEIERRLQALNG